MTNKNALEQLAQGRCKPRYHLGWGMRPRSAAASRSRAERARPDHGGLNRPAFGEARDLRLVELFLYKPLASSLKSHFSAATWATARATTTRMGSARACWSSSHSPRLAGRPARRVLFLVNVVIFHLWARV